MTFFNPEIPGLSHGNPGISGLEKWAGIPGLQSLIARNKYLKRTFAVVSIGYNLGRSSTTL